MTGGLGIQALLYTRFEDVEGYVIASADPPEAIGEKQFKDIGGHFLPDKDLCGRVISLNLGAHRMMGVPVRLEGSQYSRSAFVFCVCFVVEVDSVIAKPHVYRALANQLATAFASLEEEADLRLLSEDKHGELVRSALAEIRFQLNDTSFSHVFVKLTESHAVCFSPSSGCEPLPLQDPAMFMIPTPLVDRERLLGGEAMVDSVIAACDGVRNLSEICAFFEESVGTHPIFPSDRTLVLDVLKELAAFEILAFLPPVDEHSRFRLSLEAPAFFAGLDQRSEAAAFCGVSVREVLRSLVRLGELTDSVDLHRLAIFGLVRGLIKELVLYPLLTVPISDPPSNSMRGLLDECDGKTSIHTLCLRWGVNRRDFFDLSQRYSGHIKELWVG